MMAYHYGPGFDKIERYFNGLIVPENNVHHDARFMKSDVSGEAGKLPREAGITYYYKCDTQGFLKNRTRGTSLA